MGTANESERYFGVVHRGKAFGRITLEDYDEAIEELRQAKTQLEPDGDNCHVCHDSGHQAWECHHNPLAMARQASHMRYQWRCFHCGDVFTDAKAAAEHFGNRGDEKPAACGAMLVAFAEEFERYGVHRNFHNAASVKILVQDIASRCAQIASQLEDDDCTAGAVWEAIRDQFGLSKAERGVAAATADSTVSIVKATARRCAELVKSGADIQRAHAAKCKAENRWTEKEMSVSESGTEAYLTAANALDFWEYQIRNEFKLYADSGVLKHGEIRNES